MAYGLPDKRKKTEQLSPNWSQILVAGELKSNPAEDNYDATRVQLLSYVREMFISQDTRRFVMGFTLCGAVMRLWEFDRLGGVSSEAFDINKDGEQFVRFILGYFFMSEQELGLDPTIVEGRGKKCTRIQRDGKMERIVLKELIFRQRHVFGRATTCWKGHLIGSKPNNQLIIKDSWQYEDRPEEGILLKEATEAGVKNVAQYYHHETVSFRDAVDDVRTNVRKGLKMIPSISPTPSPMSTRAQL